VIDGLQGAAPPMKKKRLDSLRIERFRQIRELTIPELGHVNLVVGGNNSGKSTLLEALRFFAARAAPSVLEELLGLRGEFQLSLQERAGPLSSPASADAISNLFFGRAFPAEDGEEIYVGDISQRHFVRLEHVYHMGVDGKDVDQHAVPANQIAWERASKKHAPQLYADEALEIRASTYSGPWLINLDELFGTNSSRGTRYERLVAKLPCSYVPAGFPLYPGLADAWDDVVLTEGEKIALEALRIIEPQTRALAFVQDAGAGTVRLAAVRSLSEDRVAVLKLEGWDRPLPLSSMGDGMARVLQLVLAALRAQDGLLLVDEFENGLHHSVQVKVWEMLFSLAQTRGLQIFATTHSNDCVRAFSQVALANTEVDGKLLKLERMPDGQTVAATLGEDDLSNLLDAGIEVRG
jgi:energy-coupling factor transporter ATP-binding protein EcfA2